MNNVVQVFRQEKTVGPSNHDTIVIFAVSDILASHADLTLTIKAPSAHLDALDQIVPWLSGGFPFCLVCVSCIFDVCSWHV
jgi:hypothetical protein